MRNALTQHHGTSTDSKIQSLFNIYLNVHMGRWVDEKEMFQGYQGVLNHGGKEGKKQLKPQEIFDRVCRKQSVKSYIKTTNPTNGMNGSHNGLYKALQEHAELKIVHPLLYTMFAKDFAPEIIEKNLRLFGCLVKRTWATLDRIPTKRLGNLASSIANCIYTGDWTEEQSLGLLREELLKYDENTDNLLTDGIFKEKLSGKIMFDPSKAKDIFLSMLRWTAQTKGEDFKNSSDMHIEHILPKTFPKRGGWKQFEASEMHTAFSQRLGNLMLLSEADNVEAKQSSYKDKLPIYKDSNYFRISFLQDVEEWTPEAIQTRQDKIAEKLCEIWRFR